MTVRLDKDTVFLEGVCPVEDAEALFSHLEGQSDRVVNLSVCDSLHSAVLQVVLCFAPWVEGVPRDPFLQSWVVPSLVALSRDRTLMHTGMVRNVS